MSDQFCKCNNLRVTSRLFPGMNAILCGVAIMITAKLSSVFLGEKPVRYLYYRAPCSILTDHTSALNVREQSIRYGVA